LGILGSKISSPETGGSRISEEASEVKNGFTRPGSFVSFVAKKDRNHLPHTKYVKKNFHHKDTAEHKAITRIKSFTLAGI
jgi:hypothetical protein